MSFFGKLSDSISGHFDKQRKQKEKFQEMQNEADMEAQIVFNQEFKAGALEVAKAKAHRDASKLSGVQKLRAMNRSRRLTEPGNKGNIMGRFSAFTQTNIQKREENMKRTLEIQNEAKKMREEGLAKQQQERQDKILTNQNRNGFGSTPKPQRQVQGSPFSQRKSTWKM